MPTHIFRASLKAAGSELWVKSAAPMGEDPQGEVKKAPPVLSWESRRSHSKC